MSPNLISLLHYQIKEAAANGKPLLDDYVKSLLEMERMSKVNNNSEISSVKPLHREKARLSVISQ